MFCYTCPTCGKVTVVERREDAPQRPFCCQRCRLIDLGKWFNGEYVISDPLPVDPAEWDPDAPGDQPE